MNYDIIARLVPTSSGRSLSILLSNGSLLGVLRNDLAYNVARGKKSSAPIRLRDDAGGWITSGWLNTTKKEVLALKDAKGILIGFVKPEVIVSLVGHTIKEWLVYRRGEGKDVQG